LLISYPLSGKTPLTSLMYGEIDIHACKIQYKFSVKMVPSQCTCSDVPVFLRAHHKDGVGYRQVMLGVQLIFSSRRKRPSGSGSSQPPRLACRQNRRSCVRGQCPVCSSEDLSDDRRTPTLGHCVPNMWREFWLWWAIRR
jgi:hypothetical protein